MVQHYYYAIYQMDKLLYHCLWAPKVPSVFCYVCWGVDSANIILCPWLWLILPKGCPREIEKQEEGRRHCLILMRHVSSVAGHLKQQEIVPAFNLFRHSQCHWAFSDIPASPHIQGQSPELIAPLSFFSGLLSSDNPTSSLCLSSSKVGSSFLHLL